MKCNYMMFHTVDPQIAVDDLKILQQVEAETKADFVKLFPYAKSHNNEQTAAELLYLITRNTGFETKKGKLGECFFVNCCEWNSRQADDFCGLDMKKITADEKKQQIVAQSVLKTAFEKVGL